MAAEWLLLLGILGASAALGRVLWQARAAAAALHMDLVATLARRRQAQRSLETQRQLEQAQALAELAVAGTTEAVRAVHQGIAAIPFGLLEALPQTRGPARLVRGLHDSISGAIYDTIGGVNRAVGSALRGAIGNPEPTSSAPPGPGERDPS